jgi:hypothetical protein
MLAFTLIMAVYTLRIPSCVLELTILKPLIRNIILMPKATKFLDIVSQFLCISLGNNIHIANSLSSVVYSVSPGDNT